MIYVTPREELFSIFGFSVKAWGLFVAMGIVIALWFILREAKKTKQQEKIANLVMFIIIPGLIFARLAYLIINPELLTFSTFFQLGGGGMIGWGGIIGGIIGIFLFKILTKTKSSEIWQMLDLMAPYIALAFAIGRIGCFLRGCCFGLPTDLPWAVSYISNSLSSQAGLSAVHPTQVYHSIADLIIFFILIKMKKHNNIMGKIFLTFISLYSLERILIDFFRWYPLNEYLGFLTITQLVYIAMLFVSILIIKKKENRN